MLLHSLLAVTLLSGTVVSATDSSVTIQVAPEHERVVEYLEKRGISTGDEVTVEFTDETWMQNGATFEVGEKVFATGAYEDGTLEAKTVSDHAPKRALKVRHHVRKHVREHRAEQSE